MPPCARRCRGSDLVPPRRGRRPKRVPAVEDWLTALTGPDGRFDAEPDELDALAQALRPWDDVGTGTVGPARATFRLSEIETDDARDVGGLVVAAGVPVAVDGGPEPAGPRRAGVERRRQPAPVAGPTAGAAADRAGPGQPDLPGARAGPAHRAPVRARHSTPTAPTGSCRARPRCSTRPGSACCCRPGGIGAASWGSPCPRTPRSTEW